MSSHSLQFNQVLVVEVAACCKMSLVLTQVYKSFQAIHQRLLIVIFPRQTWTRLLMAGISRLKLTQ